MVDKEEGNLQAKVFFIWGATCTMSLLFAYFFVPETKGLSLEQVDQMMSECTPRNSAAWVPHESFTQRKHREHDADVAAHAQATEKFEHNEEKL